MKRSMMEWGESGGLEWDGIVVEWKVRVRYPDGKDGVGRVGARKDFSLRDPHGHGPRGDGGGVKEAEREGISSD